jgi:hypothetical protein
MRVGKFVRLQRDFGVNAEGAALIVELLDRIDLLEQRLRHFDGRWAPGRCTAPRLPFPAARWWPAGATPGTRFQSQRFRRCSAEPSSAW